MLPKTWIGGLSTTPRHVEHEVPNGLPVRKMSDMRRAMIRVFVSTCLLALTRLKIG
jgi:hypothetical protein